MAMICKNGAKECDGCMKCHGEVEPLRCLSCGEKLDYFDTIYYFKESTEIVGCEYCIGKKSADALEDL